MAVIIVRKPQLSELIYKVSEGAIKEAIQLGVCEDSPAHEINELLSQSVPVTHPRANKRMDDLFFNVLKGEVVHLFFIKCNTCEDRGKIPVFDECPKCSGAGCKNCNNEGTVRNFIKCPTCTPFDKLKPKR